MNQIMWLIILLAGIGAGGGVGYFLRKKFVESRRDDVERQGKKIIENALAESEQIKKESSLQIKDEAYHLKLETEKEIKERKSDITEEEKRLNTKAGSA